MKDEMMKIGLGFEEVGKMKKRKKRGNKRKRILRIVEEKEVIKRIGLKNEGNEEELKSI